MSRRRSIPIALLTLLALVLTACAGLPTSGRINYGLGTTDAPDDEEISFLLPDSPQPGATPVQIVEGFVRAGSGPGLGARWDRAREFLTEEFAGVWNPEAAVTIDVLEDRVPRETPEGNVELAVTAVATDMAVHASARDVHSNLRYIPQTDRVVYVSDGAPITGTEHAKELGISYASRERMSFRWERLEVTPLGDAAAAVTGWALTSVTPAGGQPVRQRYIFTMVFARDRAGWKRVLAQKARLTE